MIYIQTLDAQTDILVLALPVLKVTTKSPTLESMNLF